MSKLQWRSVGGIEETVCCQPHEPRVDGTPIRIVYQLSIALFRKYIVVYLSQKFDEQGPVMEMFKGAQKYSASPLPGSRV